MSGFDRILFRGTLRSISYRDGFDRFLKYHGILHRRFSPFVGELSQTVKDHVQAVVKRSGRPYIYLEMYDKQQSVLRIETTMNNPRDFKRLRETTRNGQPCLQWLPIRKGLADIARRLQVSRAAN